MLADLSVNHVERQVLVCGFSVERVRHDYGYDLTMATYDDTGEVEPGGVYIQVKATDRLPLPAGGKTISWSISRRDLKLWLAETYPVILVVYDGQTDKAYWIDVQACLADRPPPHLFTGSDTISFHIPLKNRFNPRAIRAIARWKNEVHKLARRRRPKDV